MDGGGTLRLDCSQCRAPLAEATSGADTIVAAGAVWHLQEPAWAPWIRDLIDQSGWTRGRLNCTGCGSRVGGFDFVGADAQVHVTRSKADVRRR